MLNARMLEHQQLLGGEHLRSAARLRRVLVNALLAMRFKTRVILAVAWVW